MRREVRAGFEAGATNLSFGLVYLPGAHADTDELVAVAEVAAEYEEADRPARPQRGRGPARGDRRDARGLAPLGRFAASLAPEVVRRRGVDRAVARESRGAGLSFDQYPYGAGCTLLASLLPAWAQEGGGGDARADGRPGCGREDRVRRRARPRGAGRTCSPPPGPIGSWSRVRASPTVAAETGRDGRGAAARVGARCADGDALRLRGRGREDRQAPADAAGLGRDLRPPSASADREKRGAVPRSLLRDSRRARAAEGSRPADRACGRPLRPRRPRPDRGREARRPRPARSGGLPGHGDLRAAAAPRGRRRRRVGGRRAGVGRRHTGARAEVSSGEARREMPSIARRAGTRRPRCAAAQGRRRRAAAAARARAAGRARRAR